jgi:hypothetical protein
VSEFVIFAYWKCLQNFGLEDLKESGISGSLDGTGWIMDF